MLFSSTFLTKLEGFLRKTKPRLCSITLNNSKLNLMAKMDLLFGAKRAHPSLKSCNILGTNRARKFNSKYHNNLPTTAGRNTLKTIRLL
jgi:hypothetical protein